MDTSYINAHTSDDDFVIHRKDSNTSVVDNMVNASKKSSSWIVESCGMCTEYMDKQVQYEIMSQRFQGAAQAASSSLRSTGANFDIHAAVGACHQNFDDIKATAAMMFDEESVVESVDMR
jgi:hypothetical protein